MIKVWYLIITTAYGSGDPAIDYGIAEKRQVVRVFSEEVCRGAVDRLNGKFTTTNNQRFRWEVECKSLVLTKPKKK
jgi:hypothetical protein